VLFDWDGTLVDSAASTFRCYVRLFARYGITFDQEAFRESYSPNWHRTYVYVGLDRRRWDEADRLWLELYAEERNRLLPGAHQNLTRIADAGLALGLVTSGDRDRVQFELADLGLARFFGVVVCGGDVPNRKPHPEALQTALAGLEVPPEAAAYVGDSPEDVEMARAAEVFSVGIPGGFPNGEALRAADPDLWASSLEEAVAGLMQRQRETSSRPAPSRGRG
jgi:HAD superfamily hydrolase (TIGR01549 family)